MRFVRLLGTAAVVSALAACGSAKTRTDEVDAKPECECRAPQDDDGDECRCGHCAMRESGMEPAACPCSGRR